MKNPNDDDFRILRWIDGELTDDDVKDLVKEAPELIDEKHSTLEIGKMMKKALPQEEEVPYADFFNHRILNRIENLQVEEKQEAAAPLEPVVPSLSRFIGSLFNSQSMVLGGAAAMGLAMFCAGLIVLAGMNGRRTEVIGSYVPHDEFTATSHYDSASEAAVFEIDGMPELSAQHQVSGYFPGETEVDPIAGTTTIYSPDGKPMLMLTTGADGTPKLQELTLTAGL